jgi:hypothetical protein
MSSIDFRHEYASRLVERGVPLAQVRDLLGHGSITTTERYDNQKLENLQVAAAKLECGMTFDAPQSEPPRLWSRASPAEAAQRPITRRRRDTVSRISQARGLQSNLTN